MKTVPLSANDSVTIVDPATLSLKENFLIWVAGAIVVGTFLFLVAYLLRCPGRKDYFLELGKTSQTVAVAIFIAGIIQPYLSGGTVDRGLLLATILFFAVFMGLGFLLIIMNTSERR